jgi:hypothetical protein
VAKDNEGLCDRRCLYAKTHDCECRCGGRNHGVLRLAEEIGQQPELWLGHIPYIAAAFALRKCLNCGSEDLDILGYPHDGGIYISQYRMKLWVFGRCRRCGYENSLEKLEYARRRQPDADVDDLAYYLAVCSGFAKQDFVAVLAEGKDSYINIVDRVAGLVFDNGVRLDTFKDYFRFRLYWDKYVIKSLYRRLRKENPDVDARIASRAAEYLRVLPKPPLNP